MTSEVLIRKAVSTDIDAMIELLRLLFTIETDFVFDGDRQRLGLTLLLQAESTGCMLVAERGQHIVGMCTAQLLVSTAEGGIKALIEDVVVAESCRRQGVGTQLLMAIKQWAARQGAKRVDLLADRRNNKALDFYQRLGWLETKLICLQKKL